MLKVNELNERLTTCTTKIHCAIWRILEISFLFDGIVKSLIQLITKQIQQLVCKESTNSTERSPTLSTVSLRTRTHTGYKTSPTLSHKLVLVLSTRNVCYNYSLSHQLCVKSRRLAVNPAILTPRTVRLLDESNCRLTTLLKRYTRMCKTVTHRPAYCLPRLESSRYKMPRQRCSAVEKER